MAFSLSLSLLMAVAGASKLSSVVFVNNNEMSGKKSGVFQFELSSRRATKLPVSLTSDYDYVSGAAVCDGAYYAIYTEIETGAIGLARIANFSSSATVSYLAVPSLLHGVWCDPRQPGKLLVVRSDPGSTQAIFHIARYDPATQTSADIAQIPPSWTWAEDDAVFAFDADAYRVWATGPVTSGIFENSGAVYAVGECTGARTLPSPVPPPEKFTKHHHTPLTQTDVAANGTFTAFTLGYEAGWLGYVYPTSATTGFGYRQTDKNYDLRWATFSLAGGKITYTDGATVSTTLWAGGAPLAACDDLIVAASLPSNNLTVADARTGETIWALPLADLGVPAPNAGALFALCA